MRRKWTAFGLAIAGIALGIAPAAEAATTGPVQAAGGPAAAFFRPPPESAIPHSAFGKEVRLGEEIFPHTGKYAGAFVGNSLNYSNCHIDGGRLPGAAPLWAAYVAFPAYRSKNGHVNTFEERMQGCFRFSMNGKAPPLASKVLVALQSYAFWLAYGAPVGVRLPGRGYPRLPKPAEAPSYARGAMIYGQRCALCHGPTGAGQSAGGKVVFPPLWGPKSFNWGAGMTLLVNASAFIGANMPLGLGHSPTNQQAWDVAMFVDSHERPQDPRYLGSIAKTRAKFHNSPYSMCGRVVNRHLVGVGTAN